MRILLFSILVFYSWRWHVPFRYPLFWQFVYSYSLFCQFGPLKYVHFRVSPQSWLDGWLFFSQFFVLIAWKWKSLSCVRLFVPPGLYSLWNSQGQNTGVGSLSLLQGIFPTQGSNPSLLHCRRILHQLSHKGNSRILEWVAYPFSKGLPDPGIKPGFPALQADSIPTELSGKPSFP